MTDQVGIQHALGNVASKLSSLTGLNQRTRLLRLYTPLGAEGLLAERVTIAEGLFSWFEHQGDAHDLRTLGAHTLVIADHNGAFARLTRSPASATPSPAPCSRKTASPAGMATARSRAAACTAPAGTTAP
jgi:hypothetical protein